MSGRKGRSGRKKVPSTIVNEILENDAQQLPAYFRKLGELALQGDKDVLIYLIDRHLGRPKQATDIKMESQVLIASADALEKVYQRLFTPIGKVKELKEGNGALQRETEGQAMAQDKNEGKKG